MRCKRGKRAARVLLQFILPTSHRLNTGLNMFYILRRKDILAKSRLNKNLKKL